MACFAPSLFFLGVFAPTFIRYRFSSLLRGPHPFESIGIVAELDGGQYQLGEGDERSQNVQDQVRDHPSYKENADCCSYHAVFSKMSRNIL